MHASAYKLMFEFVSKYLSVQGDLCVLDVGARIVSAERKQHLRCNRILFDKQNWVYKGADIVAGKNVDIVLKAPYCWELQQQYDVIVSASVLEHVEDMFSWVKEIKKALKPNGLCCIATVNTWREHKYPVDCWRIFPDGMNYLLHNVAKLQVLECYKSGRDTVGIAKNTTNEPG